MRRGVDATTFDGICHASQTRKSPFYQHFSDQEDLVRCSLDDQAQALLSDQRQQLADVTHMAGLDTWRDNLVAANRQRGGAFGCVLATMVSKMADRDETSRIQVAGYFAEWRPLTFVFDDGVLAHEESQPTHPIHGNPTGAFKRRWARTWSAPTSPN